MKKIIVDSCRSYNSLQGSPHLLKLLPAIGILTFAVWGLAPFLRQSRNVLLHVWVCLFWLYFFVHIPLRLFLVWQQCLIMVQKSDNSWGKSGTYHVMTFYLQPLLLWTGAMLVCRLVHSIASRDLSSWLIYFLMASWCMKYISCRALDPMVLPTEASQIVKQRLLNFVKSLSTVLASAYCLSR